MNVLVGGEWERKLFFDRDDIDCEIGVLVGEFFDDVHQYPITLHGVAA